MHQIMFAIVPVLMGLTVVAFIAMVIYLILHGSKAEKERTAALRAWATANGYRFLAGQDATFDERYPHLSQFKQGHSRSASNQILGSITINRRAHPFVAGDYTYKTTSTDSKGRTTTTTHHFGFVVLSSPYPGLPAITIRREHFFDKVSGLFGFDDIDFEDAEFSKRFHVKSKDRRFAYDLCSVRMIEFLKGHPKPPTITMERSDLLLTASRWKTPEEIAEYLGFAEAFIDRWPDHLLAELEGESGFRTGITTKDSGA